MERREMVGDMWIKEGVGEGSFQLLIQSAVVENQCDRIRERLREGLGPNENDQTAIA